jgi:hypothetical protein
MDVLSIYTRADRRLLILTATVLVAGIAFTDLFTKPYISIGFRYLFPIMLISGILPRWLIVCVALVSALLQEVFSNLPSSEVIVRLILSSAGFVGTGLFVFELVRNRRIVMRHLEGIFPNLGHNYGAVADVVNADVWSFFGENPPQQAALRH